MSIKQSSTVQVRRGLQANLPQLAPGEFGFSVDELRLFIGNDTVMNGSPYEGNTEILTSFGLQRLFEPIYSQTVVLLDNIATPTSSNVSVSGNLVPTGFWTFEISRGGQLQEGIFTFALNGNTSVDWASETTGADLGVSLSATVANSYIYLDYTTTATGNNAIMTVTLNTTPPL